MQLNKFLSKSNQLDKNPVAAALGGAETVAGAVGKLVGAEKGEIFLKIKLKKIKNKITSSMNQKEMNLLKLLKLIKNLEKMLNQ